MNNGTFTYQVTKSGKVFLFWDGKRIKILDGNAAQKFLAKIDGLDEEESQLVMAKETGNFKRGNERQGKDRDVCQAMTDEATCYEQRLAACCCRIELNIVVFKIDTQRLTFFTRATQRALPRKE